MKVFIFSCGAFFLTPNFTCKLISIFIEYQYTNHKEMLCPSTLLAFCVCLHLLCRHCERRTVAEVTDLMVLPVSPQVITTVGLNYANTLHMRLVASGASQFVIHKDKCRPYCRMSRKLRIHTSLDVNILLV
jgi:hypothetical protein